MPTRWIPYVKVLVHLVCLVPAFQLVQMYRSGALGLMADPVNYITHQTGYWALFLLMASLAGANERPMRVAADFTVIRGAPGRARNNRSVAELALIGPSVPRHSCCSERDRFSKSVASATALRHAAANLATQRSVPSFAAAEIAGPRYLVACNPPT